MVNDGTIVKTKKPQKLLKKAIPELPLKIFRECPEGSLNNELLRIEQKQVYIY
jgi:hypothetical protein